MAKENSEKKKEGLTLEKPDNYLLLLFGLCVVYLGTVFIFLGGYKFFSADKIAEIITISLGMLTFLSVFFGFVIKDSEKYLAAFKEVIDNYEKRFHEELKQETQKGVNMDYLGDLRGRYSSLKEYIRFVSPMLWFYFSVVIFLLVLPFSWVTISNVDLKTYIISTLIHLGILCSLLLIVSVISLHVCYIRMKKRKI